MSYILKATNSVFLTNFFSIEFVKIFLSLFFWVIFITAFYKFISLLGNFSHGFTYSGHPVACAVALEALKIYKYVPYIKVLANYKFEELVYRPGILISNCVVWLKLLSF